MTNQLGRRDFTRYIARLSAGGIIVSTLGSGATVASGEPKAELTLASPGLSGLVRDARTKRPIARATVRLDWSGQTALTDSEGIFFLPTAPGTYAITASAPGYDIYSYSNRQAVSPDTVAQPIVFDLFPEGGPTEADDLGVLLGLQTETLPLGTEQSEPLAPSGALAVETLPSFIKLRSGVTGAYYWVPLEDYVMGVVPAEAYGSWPIETLKAQAVCARTYGVRRFLDAGFVWDNSSGQNFIPSKRTPKSDAATLATAGVCLYWNGVLITSFYFSTCNGISTRDYSSAVVNNNGICSYVYWGNYPYLLAKECTLHIPSPLTNCGYYGHGEGMCQWGSKYRGDQGLSYADILMSYYTGCELRTTPVPPPKRLFVPNIRKGS